jgi:hypothetical protein
VLGREVVESKECIAIFDEAFDRLLVFDASNLEAHSSWSSQLRFAQSRALWRKASDEFTVPLGRGLVIPSNR